MSLSALKTVLIMGGAFLGGGLLMMTYQQRAGGKALLEGIVGVVPPAPVALDVSSKMAPVTAVAAPAVAPPAAGPLPAWSAVRERSLGAVLKIVAKGKDGAAETAGTGFFVSADGLVLTNAHVIGEDGRPRVATLSGAEFPLESVVLCDEDQDVAVLKVKAQDVVHLKVVEGKLPPGAAVMALGNPLGMAGSLSTGVVSAYRDTEGPVPGLMQLTAPVSPGSSGSPVLNEAGEVVGMITFKLQKGEGLGFAVVGEVLKSVLNQNVQSTPEDEPVVQPQPRRYALTEPFLETKAGQEVSVALKGEPARQIEVIRRVLSHVKDEPMLYVYLSQAQRRDGDYEGAYKSAMEVLKNDPGHWLANESAVDVAGRVPHLDERKMTESAVRADALNYRMRESYVLRLSEDKEYAAANLEAQRLYSIAPFYPLASMRLVGAVGDETMRSATVRLGGRPDHDRLYLESLMALGDHMETAMRVIDFLREGSLKNAEKLAEFASKHPRGSFAMLLQVCQDITLGRTGHHYRSEPALVLNKAFEEADAKHPELVETLRRDPSFTPEHMSMLEICVFNVEFWNVLSSGDKAKMHQFLDTFALGHLFEPGPELADGLQARRRAEFIGKLADEVVRYKRLTREVVTANASRRMSTVKEEEYVPSLMMDLWLARDRQLILECEHLSKSEREALTEVMRAVPDAEAVRGRLESLPRTDSYWQYYGEDMANRIYVASILGWKLATNRK
jgi:S1-C subfamily serine protease